MSVSLDIEVPRNGHYHQDWQLLDSDSAPINLTGQALTMDCCAIAGGNNVIASATIALNDPINGRFTVTWSGADFGTVKGETEIIRLAYDLKRTFTGISEIPVRGHIILMPEVTQ